MYVTGAKKRGVGGAAMRGLIKGERKKGSRWVGQRGVISKNWNKKGVQGGGGVRASSVALSSWANIKYYS